MVGAQWSPRKKPVILTTGFHRTEACPWLPRDLGIYLQTCFGGYIATDTQNIYLYLVYGCADVMVFDCGQLLTVSAVSPEQIHCNGGPARGGHGGLPAGFASPGQATRHPAH